MSKRYNSLGLNPFTEEKESEVSSVSNSDSEEHTDAQLASEDDSATHKKSKGNCKIKPGESLDRLVRIPKLTHVQTSPLL